MMKNPQKLALAQIETSDDDLRVYNPQQDQVHVLNPTAALIWTHCDGRTDPPALSAMLQQELDLPSDIADELLWLTLDELEKAGLMQTSVTGARHVHTRRQVIKILSMVGLSAALAPLAQPVHAESSIQTYRVFLPLIRHDLTTATSSTSSSSSTSSTSSSSSTSSTSSSSSTSSTSSSSSTSSTSSTTDTDDRDNRDDDVYDHQTGCVESFDVVSSCTVS